MTRLEVKYPQPFRYETSMIWGDKHDKKSQIRFWIKPRNGHGQEEFDKVMDLVMIQTPVFNPFTLKALGLLLMILAIDFLYSVEGVQTRDSEDEEWQLAYPKGDQIGN